MSERRTTKGRIKVFSNTTEPGVAGQLRRVAEWRHRPVVELAGAVTRRALRRRDPFRLLEFPQAVHIEITNRCNLACVMCPHPTMEREQGLMSEAMFCRVIDEIARHKLLLENVAIMGLGEPLLHPGFEDFVRIAHEAGIPNLYVSTNGTTLTEKRARRLVADGALGRVIISLDGASKNTYEAIRVGADFDRVMDNTRQLLEIKRELGVRKPVVTLQILAMPQTKDELDEFCAAWEPLLGEGDEVLIKEVDTFGGLVTDVRLDASREPVERYACRMLWKDVSISWDGRVTVCCKDVFYKLAVDTLEGGRTIADIWNSPRWQAYRRMHVNGHWDRMDPCDVCREWYV
ncbi:radical SAM protein [bacterium]|nr:radical SAM protein [bacterium]